MNDRTAMLEALEALDGNLSLQIDSVLSMMRDDNVESLITAMPPDFRARFIAWMRSKYIPGGDRVTIGARVNEAPFEGIRAACRWLETAAA